MVNIVNLKSYRTMSSTADFTETRKTAFEKENHLLLSRSTTSSLKRPLFPRKLSTLRPLDLNQIKREIEEAESFERASDEDILKSDCPTKEKTEESKHLSQEKVQGEENIAIKPSENSFDLDFSVLSICTPAKKVENVPVTPNTKTSLKKEVVKFDQFVTPNVKIELPSKIHCSIPRNTPVTSTTKKQIRKPEIVQNNVVCSIPRAIPDQTFSKLNVNNKEYLILNLLGRGGSSLVYQCFCVETKSLVAIKCVSLENSASAQGFINEAALLHQLQNCDRVIQLYDYQVLENEKKLLMVLEKGGEDFTKVLKDLANQKLNIPIYMLIFYWMEMLQAVKQIHSHGVIHSDLKPSNFLWGDKGLKLIDFGIASSVQTDMTSVIKSVPEGSCNYMSPEALKDDTLSSPGRSKYKLHYKSDVWSLGCILYQLVYKRTPFQHINNLWSKLACIMNPNHCIEYPEADWVPSYILNTIKKCLQYNVKSRPSVDELIEEFEMCALCK